MDPLVAGALIGAGASYLGGRKSDDSAEAAAKKNVKYQKQFAQQGIRWRVADAKAAGVSAEAALGASGAQFQPTFTGGQSGSMAADAGQNIARAVMASSTAEDRKMEAALKAETLRGMRIENDHKAQLTRVNVPGNPPFPHDRGNVIPGQGNSPVRDVPLERTGQAPGARHSEGASVPSVGWAETADGGLRPIPSQDIKNRIEDQVIPEVLWAGQNLVAPNFGKGPKPPESALPKGAHWRWSVSRQAWYPSKGRRNLGDKAWEFVEPLYKYFNDRTEATRRFRKGQYRLRKGG